MVKHKHEPVVHASTAFGTGTMNFGSNQPEFMSTFSLKCLRMVTIHTHHHMEDLGFTMIEISKIRVSKM